MSVDLQTAVDTALGFANAVLLNQSVDVDLRLKAAELVLDFAATVSRPAPVAEPVGCQHDERINMTTMGGGPVKEVCRQCGARFEDGVIVRSEP